MSANNDALNASASDQNIAEERTNSETLLQ